MSNVYNFYIGSQNPTEVETKAPIDVSQYLGEIEELKNEVMAEKEKTRQVIEELQEYKYMIYSEFIALTLSHGGKLKMNKSIFQFALSHPDKVSIEFLDSGDSKEYVARMEEVTNAD